MAVSLVSALTGRADCTAEYSVQVSADVKASPAQITLSWPQDTVSTPKNYAVYRRAPGATSWGHAKILSGATTSYVDKNVSAGVPYEYQIVKKGSECTGYGYIYSGIDVPLTENRGKLLLVVDNTYARQLDSELARLQQDLVGDGWTVSRIDVSRHDSPVHVKAQIKAQYEQDEANTKAVFLFGHVPVPYSGDIVPDGHYSNHQGAWPCDGYYADMDGTWTDDSVDDTTAEDPRNHNVPGDGKFDQSTFPAPLKLMVGRVDLANMPGRLSAGGPATFPSELELLRNYLNKDHNFRNKITTAPERAIVGDFFGVRDGEAFAASGWRNFAPFFGASKITTVAKEGAWLPTLRTNAYLFAYGCGSGSYTSIGGIGNIGQYRDGVTTELVQDDVKAVFTLLYGSWLGDWDSEDNIQRAVLATKDMGLTCSWSGRPHWFMHHMALGKPIGYSTLLTQNDGFSGLYKNQENNCAGWTHIALMGDPTLRMQMVAPASDVTIAVNGNDADLAWTASTDEVEGYNIYRATNPSGPFTRVNNSLVKGTTFADANAASGKYTYMVRAVTLEKSASGTYFNPSEGAFASLSSASMNVAKTTTPAKHAVTVKPQAKADITTALGRNLSPTGATNSTDTIWFDDALPLGAVKDNNNDAWNWVNKNPVPESGTREHQSLIRAGFHQHMFTKATQVMSVGTNDTVYTYVYLDPANVPSEVMLQWDNGTWYHRAYWGQSNITTLSTNGTAASLYYAGPLPTPGQWVRLEVPASMLNLGNTYVSGMAFTLYGGRATWDNSGKSTPSSNTGTGGGTTNSGGGSTNSGGGTTGTGGSTTNSTPPNTNTISSDVTWVDDALPAGASPDYSGGDTWDWVSTNPTPELGSLSHQSAIALGLHQHFFTGATTPLEIGSNDTVYTYAYIDPANIPDEIMLQWNDGASWEHRAYWGNNDIPWGTSGTSSLYYMGAIPQAGQWIRLEVNASQLGLQGASVSGIAYTLFNGRVTWDNSGKSTPMSTSGSSGSGSTNSSGSGSLTNSSGGGSLTNSSGGGGSSTNSTGSGSNTNSTGGTGTNSLTLTPWFSYPLPTGAAEDWNVDAWDWVNSNPTPYSGTFVHQSAIAAGLHQHMFTGATQTMSVGSNDVLYCYVYVDPANLPSELMLQWNDGSTYNHRAYWGANDINMGTDGTTTRQSMGALPPAGQWVQLQVPASAVGLQGVTVSGMAFTMYDGRATWDVTGKGTPGSGGGGGGGITVTNPPGGGSGGTTNPASPLSVALASPVNNATYAAPANILLNATFSGAATNMEFLSGSTVIGNSSVANGVTSTNGATPALAQTSAGLTWSNVPVGTYSVTAEVTDNTGASADSTTVTVIVTNASVTNPTNPPSTNSPTPPLTNNLTGPSNWLHTATADDMGCVVPEPGQNVLHVLTPTLLELKHINTAPVGSTTPNDWASTSPSPSSFAVTANGSSISIAAVGYKRRPLYAPLISYNLRIENDLYIQLASPISDNEVIQVSNPDGTWWGTGSTFSATADPLRFNPAIHVNEEGYMPNYSKTAMIGYWAGTLGEVTLPASSGFKIVDANTGATVFTGTLTSRLDSGWQYSPTPYQQVYQADFTSFTTPGQYRLVVPGMGASLPFNITDGIAMAFARTYALGLYNQRCGTNISLPWSRFAHGGCHTNPATIPWPPQNYAWTWQTISNYGLQINPDNPTQTAPAINANTLLFPYVNQGTVNVSGGHHDAGDYSKYMTDSASTMHALMFAVDSLPGVAQLDNLGIPESGDGISDLMQEAKWEADYIAKMQDADGGFYFIVYPTTREYESDVTPDHGDPQIVWPKTSTATASAVAALAQCASSPKFKAAYPQAAAQYLTEAKMGWTFLTNAIAKYGKNGIYQKITHYGDDFADQDELAWAACEMFLATGDPVIQQTLESWYDPSNAATYRWGWWHMAECYGNAARSYAFAVTSGRLTSSQIDPAYMAKCQAEVIAGGDMMLTFAQQSAYGTSFPSETKAVQGAGWYFSNDQAYDMAVAYQLNHNQAYITAILQNMNYEGGCNPVNVSYLAGLGWKRPLDMVSQYELNAGRKSPTTGEPEGNVESGFSSLWTYPNNQIEALVYPADSGNGQVPFYDRWGDSWNVQDEFVILNQARALGSLAFIAAQTSLQTQQWKAVLGQINISTTTNGDEQFSLSAPGVDLTGAKIVWETRDASSPVMGQTYTFTPVINDSQWIEAEATMPDGRRIVATNNFTPTVANVVWVDDSVPTGAEAGADGGDPWSWNWVSSSPTPYSGQYAWQSAIATGEHQYLFQNATATMSVPAGGATLYCYIYIDPANPPSEVMLQWNDGTSWEHRAYWGANNIAYGTSGASRYYMGPLPATGQWVKLAVPSSAVGLSGSTLTGMAFTLYGGRATWDYAGESTQ